MAAPSQENVRAYYSGRQCLGYIAIVADGFHAQTVDRCELGVFASQEAACTAIAAACGLQTPARQMI